ncbi:MAG: nicotinamide-nucleotide amidohydrolase family protein, partial [Candidatus Obscuribacterales bacterium]|nr:nicotinamide-nucleotide amidohydrolase family protein [Candidatus Obscuribacterales bacterium]
ASPYIMQQRMGGTIFSIDLKHIGIGESSLAKKYEHLLEGKNPSVAPYAGAGECRLRVTAKAESLDQARALVMPVADDILKTSGNLCYGVDNDTLESVVARLLIKNNLTVSLAESCTGGLVSKRLTDVPGSSAFIGLNLVTYSNQAKIKELEIDAQLLSDFGAVSAECARAMAKGIRRKSDTDTGIGVTGIAGPDGGSPDKPVGLVYLALDSKMGVELVELNLGEKSTRSEIRHATANATLNMLRLFLIKHYKN